MRVTEITFKRSVQPRQYESEEITLTAIPNELEDVQACIKNLKSIVYKELGLMEGSECMPEAPVVGPDKQLDIPMKEEKKEEPKKKRTKKEPEEKKVEEKEVKKEEITVEEKVEGPKVKEEKLPRGVVAYDRSNKKHTDAMAAILKSVNPDWNSTVESKKQAREISVSLEGKPFVNSNGDVLDEFIAAVKSGFGL